MDMQQLSVESPRERQRVAESASGSLAVFSDASESDAANVIDSGAGCGAPTAASSGKWLRAPSVASVDCEAKPILEGSNRPLTVLRENGVFYVRGKKYRLEKRVNAGTRSNVYLARCVAGQPMQDVRDPRHKIDRINPPLNEEYVAVKIFRCDDAQKTDLERYEAASIVSGRPIDAGATSADDARREIQMHRFAQFYTASEKRSSGIQLLAATPIAHGETAGPVRADDTSKETLTTVAKKWLPGLSNGDATDAAKVRKARFVMTVSEYAPNGTLAGLIVDKQRPMTEAQCKWVVIDVLSQAQRLHAQHLVFSNWSDPAAIVLDGKGAARVVGFHRTRHRR